MQKAGPKANTTTQDSKEQRKVQTDEYGDWMVVNRRKMPNKHKGRTPVEVLNQSEASMNHRVASLQIGCLTQANGKEKEKLQ